MAFLIYHFSGMIAASKPLDGDQFTPFSEAERISTDGTRMFVVAGDANDNLAAVNVLTINRK